MARQTRAAWPLTLPSPHRGGTLRLPRLCSSRRDLPVDAIPSAALLYTKQNVDKSVSALYLQHMDSSSHPRPARARQGIKKIPKTGQSRAQLFVPSRDLTPLRPYPRRKIAPDLPRTRGRHPLLSDASFDQLLAAMRYRDARGVPTVYASRAAHLLLRHLLAMERKRSLLPFHRPMTPSPPAAAGGTPMRRF